MILEIGWHVYTAQYAASEMVNEHIVNRRLLHVVVFNASQSMESWILSTSIASEQDDH